MDAAPLIEVDVAGWELECCGTPFAVGDEVTWELHAAEPSDADPLPRFLEEHHGQTPDEVPQERVTGHVEAITALHSRLVRLPGAASTWTDDPDDTLLVALASAPAPPEEHPDGFGGPTYRVRLRIAADQPLPRYAPDPGIVEYERREEERHREVLRVAADDLHGALTRLADDLVDRYGAAVTAVRAASDSAVTIEPARREACRVAWALTPDGIDAVIGNGEWRLPADESGVATLAALVQAAAAGQAGERARPGELATVVTTEDGERFEAVVASPLLGDPASGGVVFGPASAFERMRRGDHDYEPWG